ncbi:conserved protein, unknown function [Plasmodium gallinaceum]|uniref:Transmembrane protein n=1 Tax=Plasmodium gallinaceum TaxID=5849 RepID=A0A1J1GPM5_PLAGA|nr:conserved protein, unknown function [Plasmodium gallinaceum]CRG94457.1 conserved protein, unknown function [Plasmodium gallinaceum]
MNYNFNSLKKSLNFKVNNVFFYYRCKVRNTKENFFNKITYSTKNNEYNNSLNINTTEKNKNEKNKIFFSNTKYKAVNSQPKRNLSVFGYNRGKLFVSIKKDFTSFVVNSLIIFVFLYSVYTLAPNETISQRRKRIIRERLMKEYEISEKDLEMIEDFDEILEK